MTIYELLKQDHQKLKGLLDQLVEFSESKRDGWQGVIDRIRDALIPHVRAEEAVFYNSIREADPNNGLITHAFTEHAMAETELRTLQAMKMIDVNWTQLATKFRHDILHHAEAEESKIFSAAQKLF